ncbi:putative glutamine ABC transporter permease protein GlnP [Agrobacterium sp. DSM 25558]|uniref:amino acid ABC transporter permease n=1 Tax=Agrobacterium sp. DSM 25558 TaxID=1907665 RepID=UPI0009726318|nr:amino acid ABC transporter permease [Agrobacterium sp. DSM 25558]SCX21906.1 putative glutamine ABC transporter permease protein GlnP [Agrobacterium sp. DSM 25558]
MLQILQEYGVLLLIGEYPHGKLGGLAMTLIISFVSLIVTFPCAILIALARAGNSKPLKNIASGFVHCVRAIPLLMLIFWAYFALPVAIGFPVDATYTLIIAIVVYQTAYLGEIIAAGIEGLPRGQMEAAKSLGLGYIPTTFKIVLPQALFNVVPGIVNQLTTIIKESSLGSIIAVPELSYAMLQVSSNEVTKPLQIFGILAGTYFVLCFALSQATGVLERRIANRRTGRVIVEAVA